MTVLVDRTGLATWTEHADGAIARARLAVLDARSVLAMPAGDDGARDTTAVRTLLDDLLVVLDRLGGLVTWPAHLAAAFGRLDDTLASDRRLAGLLDDLHDRGTDTARRGRLADVLVELPPATVARAWEDLTGADRTWLERSHPDLLGHLDGVPLEVRDRINRATVRSHVADLRARLRDPGLGATRLTGDAAWDPDPGRTALQARITRLEGLLDADRILCFDPGGDGRAVVAMGDPATARHVATVVPGIGTTLDTMPRLLREATALRAAARTLHDDVATIAWLGYDTPPGGAMIGRAALVGNPFPLAAAATRTIAEYQQQSLVDHAAGLRARNPGVHHTVVGHSYGSVLAFRALAPGGSDSRLDVDDVVALGSPGAGRDIDDLADLDLPSGVGLWSASAWGDPVPWIPDVLGPRVEELDAGVHRLPTDARNIGHARYFVAGSLSLAATAIVVAGRPTRPSTRRSAATAHGRRPTGP